MKIHIESDLTNWDEINKDGRYEKANEEHPINLANGYICTIGVEEDLALALFKMAKMVSTPDEITMVCPDREDIHLFAGSPDDFRRSFFGG